MKKEKNLRVFLYVVTILSLIYTCFTLFQAYATFTSYYANMAYSFGDVFVYVLSSCYAPLCFTIIFYVMIAALDIWCAHVENALMPGQVRLEEDAKKAAREQFEDEKDLAKGEKELARDAVKENKENIDDLAKDQKEAARELDKEGRKEVDKVIRDQKEAARKDEKLEEKEIDQQERDDIKATREIEKEAEK